MERVGEEYKESPTLVISRKNERYKNDLSRSLLVLFLYGHVIRLMKRTETLWRKIVE